MAKSLGARVVGVAFGGILLATVAAVAIFAGVGEPPPPPRPDLPRTSAEPLAFSTAAADEVLSDAVAARAVAGAVTRVVDDRGRFATSCVGEADLAAGRPMRPDTVFWIASMTKPITATAVMMLVDEGKIELNEPIATYLPEFASLGVALRPEELGAYAEVVEVETRAPKRPVAVRDLLRHVSGLPVFLTRDGRLLDEAPLAEKSDLYAKGALLDDPGTTHRYSNVGYEILGRLIEVASGMSYEEFLSTRLFEPLGMIDTTFRPTSEQLERLATTYYLPRGASDLAERRIALLHNPLDDPARHPAPSLGLFSTAPDLERFCRMHLAGGELDGVRYLSAEAWADMLKRGSRPASAASQGLGWMLGDKTAGHGGVNGTWFSVDRRNGTAAIFLTASQDGSLGPTAEAYEAYREAIEAAAGSP